MNTSMTINATAPWLLALYIAAAEKQGIARDKLQGTVQNDIIKESLARHLHLPPEPSLRLITDVISFTYREVPKWNPTNVCSYHLQEAGRRRSGAGLRALATAIAVLDHVKASGQVPADGFPQVVGGSASSSTPASASSPKSARCAPSPELWDEITRERYRRRGRKLRRFRYGVQVNSLGLTEQQPENNVYRILLEMLAVTLSKDARRRRAACRPGTRRWPAAAWDQQWSLRLQQIVAYETDLLDYGDIFDGSARSRQGRGAEAGGARRTGADRRHGGAVAPVDPATKQRLVEINARRLAAIEIRRADRRRRQQVRGVRPHPGRRRGWWIPGDRRQGGSRADRAPQDLAQARRSRR